VLQVEAYGGTIMHQLAKGVTHVVFVPRGQLHSLSMLSLQSCIYDL